MKYPEGFAICIKLVKEIAQLKFKYTSNLQLFLQVFNF